jgi:cytochrome c oxidase subunit II
MYPNVSPVTQIDNAFIYIIGVSLVILTLITIAMIYFVFRYSRKRNPKPTDIRGNWFLELIWTIIPTAIALSMFYIGWTSYISLRDVPPDAIQIKVAGEMFAWVFEYPNGKEVYEEMVVPVGKPIKMNVTSSDVLHSFFVPAFRIKVDAVPEMTTYAWFLPDSIGTYDILCAEFCGTGHADMTGRIKVVSEEEYNTWLAAEDKDDEEDWDDDDDEDDKDEEDS